MEPAEKLLNEIDADCKRHGLPLLSWIVRDIPGRKNATPEQIEQVYEAAAKGKYALLGVDISPFIH